MKRFALALAAAVAMLVWVTPVEAIPITYTEIATGTGTLDGTSFTNQFVTITLVGETSSLVGDGCCVFVPGSTTVDVSGVGNDTLTDAFSAFRTDFGSFIAAGIDDDTLGTDLILATENAAFASYDLISSVGPVSGTADYNSGLLFNTALGHFDLVSVAENSSTFTATTSTAPEPASLVLLGTGLALSVHRWRKRRTAAF